MASESSAGFVNSLARAAFAVAAAKGLTGLAHWGFAVASGAAGQGLWLNALHVAVFAAASAYLVVFSRGDRRAVHLGLFFATCASAFADALLALPGPASPLATAFRGIAIDAWLPLFLWLFVRDFPQDLGSGRGRAIAMAAIRVSQAAGALLFAANALVAVLEAGGSPTPVWIQWVSRRSEGSAYWPLLFFLALPALGYAIWRTRAAPVDERRRMGLFLGGLVVGFGPLVLEVLGEAAVPPFRRAMDESPTVVALVGWVLYPLFLSIPFTTAYAVLVHRVLDVRLIVRKAIRYALARWTVIGATALPLAVLAVWTWRHRDVTVESLLTGTRPLLLLAVSAAGAAGLVWGHHWLEAIDRRFFREAYDARRTLLALVEKSRSASAQADLADLWRREIDRAFHLESIAVLVLDPVRNAFLAASGDSRPLPAVSTLARMLAESPEPMDTELDSPRSPLHRIPAADREWLAETGAHLLQPLLASDGSLAGIIALGPKKSELPFSDEDRELLSAIATAGALTLENRLIRSTPRPRDGSVGLVAAGEETGEKAAHECGTCGRVAAPGVGECPSCGGGLESAALPLLLRGKFRVEACIGSGGMSVVYRAVDVDLQRRVALKVLPRVSPEHSLRLRREARAMAAVVHPNLATVHGLEVWRGSPVLVVEYLEGGTLANRLDRETMAPELVVSLGIVLASVLERVHEAGFLHRDVKPGNIGIAGDGTPKLLDFGLVRLITTGRLVAAASGDTLDRTTISTDDMRSLTATHRVVGTPLYLSPEALRGESPEPDFDLWSLAVTLHEATTGKNPFSAPTLQAALALIRRAEAPDARARCPGCPEALALFLRRALSRQRSARPRAARAFRERLEAIRGET